RKWPVPQPVCVLKEKSGRAQGGAGSHDDLVALGIETDDVKRLRARDFETAALADGVADNAVVASDPAAVDVHDVAGLQRAWLEALDDGRIAGPSRAANRR